MAIHFSIDLTKYLNKSDLNNGITMVDPPTKCPICGEDFIETEWVCRNCNTENEERKALLDVGLHETETYKRNKLTTMIILGICLGPLVLMILIFIIIGIIAIL